MKSKKIYIQLKNYKKIETNFTFCCINYLRQQSLTTVVKYMSYKNISTEKSPINQFLFNIGFSYTSQNLY